VGEIGYCILLEWEIRKYLTSWSCHSSRSLALTRAVTTPLGEIFPYLPLQHMQYPFNMCMPLVLPCSQPGIVDSLQLKNNQRLDEYSLYFREMKITYNKITYITIFVGASYRTNVQALYWTGDFKKFWCTCLCKTSIIPQMSYPQHILTESSCV